MVSMSVVEAQRLPTRRQLDLLVLHAEGKTFGQIGETVHLSSRTVKEDLDKLRSLLGAKTLSHALVLCMARGHLCVDSRANKPFVPDISQLIAA